MNILIVNRTQPMFEKFGNLLSDLDNSVFSADTIHQIASILDRQKIDLVLLEIKSLSDIALLDFIINTYPNVEVRLVTDCTTRHLLTTIKEGQYKIVQ